jgi:hypothetical protein
MLGIVWFTKFEKEFCGARPSNPPDVVPALKKTGKGLPIIAFPLHSTFTI